MKIKDTINFTKLREKGPKILDVQGDEVVQVVSKTGLKCIVDQEYLLTLQAERAANLVRLGLKKEQRIQIDFDKVISRIEKKSSHLINLLKEDEDIQESDLSKENTIETLENILNGFSPAIEFFAKNYSKIEETADSIGVNLDESSINEMKNFFLSYKKYNEYLNKKEK